MHINKSKALLFVIIFMLGFMPFVKSQAVYENVQNSVYEYLNRQAQNGNIVLDDMVRPLTRIQISQYLFELSVNYQKKKSILLPIEAKELDFYVKEYGFGIADGHLNEAKEKWLGKDVRGRLRFFSKIDSASTFKGKSKNIIQPFQFNVEPVLQGGLQYAGEKESIVFRAAGVQLWASLGKRFGFQMYYRDVNENGKGIDFDKQFTPQQGSMPSANPKSEALNYSDVRASMTYQWKNGMLSFGKEQYMAGYGLNGNIIYSTKAPSYPYIRFNQQILPWLKFEYTHAFLASRLVDTPNSYRTTNYGVFGGQRFKMIPKYMVSHALQFKLMKGLDLMVGESVIYTDKIQLGYWLPIMFFKAWDQYVSGTNLNAGANTQLFGQISSRNQIKNTHLYGSILIDEFRPSAIFDPKRSRNQLAFNIGGSITNIPYLPYVTLNVDYTRLNPFVYQNLLPAQEYTNNGYVIGDWMGSNADRRVFEIKYTPMPRLKISMRYEKIRKGAKGNAEQQYFQQPQPEFLFGLEQKQWNTSARVVYEMIHNIYLYGQFQRSEVKTYGAVFKTQTFTRVNAGFSVGW
jgi:hypothetical protein